MPKIQTLYICSKCGSQFPKWSGRCLECGAWGSLEKQTVDKNKEISQADISPAKTLDFEEIQAKDHPRIETNISEFDRVLGGGLVPGSLILIGGEPGIGKSTLVLQITEKIKEGKNEILYVSGEESAQQIKMRMERLNIKPQALKFLGETDINTICSTVSQTKPSLVIVDSIQTMYSPDLPSEAGSVNQVRVCTVKLLECAKKNNIPIIIIGHVTKEGMVAGPKALEHLVDTVLYLEGDQYHAYRILRTVKNRFGSTNEVGIFDMQKKGLIEVKNPSDVFISEREENIPGTAISSVMEGSRAFLVEIQALISKTVFGYPQRKSSGFDLNRLQLLTAVLGKRVGFNLSLYDIHLNVVGGIKIQEPAVDLAVASAIASTFKNKPIDPELAIIGEVGLGGEVRSTNQLEKRILEAEKMGFKRIIIPRSRQTIKSKIEMYPVKNISQAIEIALK